MTGRNPGSRRPVTGAAAKATSLTFLLALGCSSGGASAHSQAPLPAPEVNSDSPSSHSIRGSNEAFVKETPVSFTEVANSIVADPEMEAMITPFRDRMGEEIREVIGEAVVLLSKAHPEGRLGNFATDAMLWAARGAVSEPIQMAMTNNGGLRVSIPPGPITMGLMFELMPFENRLSILTLSGVQVRNLANQLARMGGEPISGFTFRIAVEGEERVARDLLIQGQDLDPEAVYRLVTNDYVASGGDNFTTILEPLARQDLPIFLRDAFVAYVRNLEVVDAELEGRIIGGNGR